MKIHLQFSQYKQQYDQFKDTIIEFHDSHPGYVWFVMEFSMVCASLYSLFGLFLVSTGALVSGNTFGMLFGFLMAPIYALVLFAVVTVVLTAILTLPYLFFSYHTAAKPAGTKASRPRARRQPAKAVRPARRAAAAK